MSALRHAILNDIAQIWNVKSDEVELNEDGFDWQPGSHMVSLRIFRDERNLFDEERFCIIVATRYRRSAPVHDPDLDRLLAAEVASDLVQRVGGKRLAISIARRTPLVGGASWPDTTTTVGTNAGG